MVDNIDLIAQRVLLTVAYSAQYCFPLTKEEIGRRFFFPVMLNRAVDCDSNFVIMNLFQDPVEGHDRLDKHGKQKNTSVCWLPFELIDLAIDRLVSTGLLDFDGKYYRLSLLHPILTNDSAVTLNLFQGPRGQSRTDISGSSTSGSKQSQIVDRQLKGAKSKQSLSFPNYLDRHQLLKFSRRKRREAQPLVDYLSTISWVKGVAITGSLALNAADEKADADLLIVTKPNRLWLTRLLVLYFAIKHGKRRSFAHEEPNSWCFNLWLDSHHLFVPRAQHSLYTAYEVCQADWVINRHHTAQKFLLANSWVRQTLPGYYIYRQKQVKKIDYVDYKQSTVGRILSPVVTLANWASYLLQLLYMLPHRTTEKVGLGFAWFHPRSNY